VSFLAGEVMESTTMGRVLVEARLENLEDVYKAAQGVLPADQVRRRTDDRYLSNCCEPTTEAP
jgi:hypothetical protein